MDAHKDSDEYSIVDETITKSLTVCSEEPLINPVRDNQLSASSSFDATHGPSRSRLHTMEEGGQRGSWSQAVTQTHSGLRYTTTLSIKFV